MSILFVLLTFLLILTVMYFRRPQPATNELQVASFPRKSELVVLNKGDFAAPEGYYFHPGHTWVVDEGHQNGRVGIDAFAANLFGKIDRIEMAEVNRWVRQGQKLCTVYQENKSVEVLAPVEGVLVSVNHELMEHPDLAIKAPYGNGWLGIIKAPELSMNLKNLLKGPLVPVWMQNSVARVSGIMQQLNPAFAQDGGVPVQGLLFQVDFRVRQQLAKEFFAL